MPEEKEEKKEQKEKQESAIISEKRREFGLRLNNQRLCCDRKFMFKNKSKLKKWNWSKIIWSNKNSWEHENWPLKS